MTPVLRVSILLLVLANVMFLAWSRLFSPAAGASPDSHLLQQQINRDAIRLLTPQEVKALVVNAACVEWGGLAPDAVAGAEESLGRLLPGVTYVQRRAEEPASYWVFLPAQNSRPAAQQKAAELRRLGVDEFFIVQDDSRYRFAISLGVFRSQESARNRMDQLRAQGVRTVQIGPRDAQLQMAYYQLRNLSEGTYASLAELRKSFPGTALKICGSDEPAPAPSPLARF